MADNLSIRPLPERSVPEERFMMAQSITPEVARKVWADWEALVRGLLKPTDYYTIKIKNGPLAGQEIPALALSGARRLKRAFQLNVDFDPQRDLVEERKENGDVVWARATVRVIDPYGNTGVGTSSINWATLHQRHPGANASVDLTTRVVSTALRNAVIQWTGVDFRTSEDENDTEREETTPTVAQAPEPSPNGSDASIPKEVTMDLPDFTGPLGELQKAMQQHPRFSFYDLRLALWRRSGKDLSQLTTDEALQYLNILKGAR